MEEEEYEYVYFWEVDGIYDTDGDLLIWSLISIAMCAYMEAKFIATGFTEWLNKELEAMNSG